MDQSEGSGVGFRPLQKEHLLETTGESTPENVTVFEAIFLEVSHVPTAALAGFSCLKQFNLIGGRLEKMPELQQVASTLTRLCLCQQKLTSMSGLVGLPLLNELYLHQNQIQKIEGLHSCPRLQRLWLYSNQISCIEGLDRLGALQQLFLQDNQISTLDGLGKLTKLQSLDVSGNRIVHLKQLEPLSRMASLRDLSLADPHFPPCPVAADKAYRDVILRHIKQVTCLDGIAIRDEDREVAEDAYLRGALEFGDRMRDLRQQNAHQLDEVEALRLKNKRNADAVKAKLHAQLHALERSVMEGRRRLVDGHKEQRRKWEAERAQAAQAVGRIQEQYSALLDAAIQERERDLASESAWAAMAVQAAEFMEREDAALQTLASRCAPSARQRHGANSSTIFEVERASAECQLIVREVTNANDLASNDGNVRHPPTDGIAESVLPGSKHGGSNASMAKGAWEALSSSRMVRAITEQSSAGGGSLPPRPDVRRPTASARDARTRGDDGSVNNDSNNNSASINSISISNSSNGYNKAGGGGGGGRGGDMAQDVVLKILAVFRVIPPDDVVGAFLGVCRDRAMRRGDLREVGKAREVGDRQQAGPSWQGGGYGQEEHDRSQSERDDVSDGDNSYSEDTCEDDESERAGEGASIPEEDEEGRDRGVRGASNGRGKEGAGGKHGVWRQMPGLRKRQGGRAGQGKEHEQGSSVIPMRLAWMYIGGSLAGGRVPACGSDGDEDATNGRREESDKATGGLEAGPNVHQDRAGSRDHSSDLLGAVETGLLCRRRQNKDDAGAGAMGACAGSESHDDGGGGKRERGVEMEDGGAAAGEDGGAPVVLFSDARRAAWEARTRALVGDLANWSIARSDAKDGPVALLMCQVAVEEDREEEVAASGQYTLTDPRRALMHYYIQVHLGNKEHLKPKIDGSHGVASDAGMWSELSQSGTLQHYLALASSLSAHPLLHPALARDGLVDKLAALERKAEEEIRQYEFKSWSLLDPEQSRALYDMNSEVARLQAVVRSLESQVAAERASQDAIISTMRARIPADVAARHGLNLGTPVPTTSTWTGGASGEPSSRGKSAVANTGAPSPSVVSSGSGNSGSASRLSVPRRTLSARGRLTGK